MHGLETSADPDVKDKDYGQGGGVQTAKDRSGATTGRGDTLDPRMQQMPRQAQSENSNDASQSYVQKQDILGVRLFDVDADKNGSIFEA